MNAGAPDDGMYPNKASTYKDYSVGGKPVYSTICIYFISWNSYKIMLIRNYDYYVLNLKPSIPMWYLLLFNRVKYEISR